MGTSTFVRAVEAQLATINRDLAELKDRVSRAGSSARQKAIAALDSLPEKRDELARKLTDIKGSLAEATEGVSRELVEACRTLRKAIDRALERAPAPGDDAEGKDAESGGTYEIYDAESPTFEPRRSEERSDSADGDRPRPEVRGKP
jgi:hypothetical protein